ncbi:hypothetical protein OIU74_020338 [Salix koriyanagi]|uniref:Uncharacterized protein n=1 Tax=Salix koriyanagi TaxID=2511006 RepID=A0A9Q0SLR4_9ROSI|nr:hypothetical protein OIU74_020338 [Salix koriyanagi]
MIKNSENAHTIGLAAVEEMMESMTFCVM